MLHLQLLLNVKFLTCSPSQEHTVLVNLFQFKNKGLLRACHCLLRTQIDWSLSPCSSRKQWRGTRRQTLRSNLKKKMVTSQTTTTSRLQVGTPKINWFLIAAFENTSPVKSLLGGMYLIQITDTSTST